MSIAILAKTDWFPCGQDVVDSRYASGMRKNHRPRLMGAAEAARCLGVAQQNLRPIPGLPKPLAVGLRGHCAHEGCGNLPIGYQREADGRWIATWSTCEKHQAEGVQVLHCGSVWLAEDIEEFAKEYAQRRSISSGSR